jgi:molybdopterin-guanine dinucleotide biosynthesis adapter protein
MIPVVFVVGRSGSGKTTLIVSLIKELRDRGLRVGSVKHAKHGFEFDRPGKDSWRLFHEAESDAMVVVSDDRLAMTARAFGKCFSLNDAMK